MSDLISRSVLLKKIEEEYDLNYGEILINPERFYEMVEAIPTAYSIEKVVAELEQYATSPICKMHKVGCPYRNNDNIACENCGALGAIDIVKRGGAE